MDVDLLFDFTLDTPEGKDPDQYSPTLRRYHKILWSKPLPCGSELQLFNKEYLAFYLGDNQIVLKSDAITHSYKNTKRMRPIIDQLPSNSVDELFSAGCTMPSYILFPGKSIDKSMTLNQARGVNHKIADRFDLTLECIRLQYLGQDNPLSNVLSVYWFFFELFVDFKGYVDFFLLQDLVTPDYGNVLLYLPHEDFTRKPLPKDVGEYLHYRYCVLSFISKRRARMLAYLSQT